MQEGFTEITHDDITADDVALLQEFERTHPPWIIKKQCPDPYSIFRAPYQAWNTSPGHKVLLTKTVPYSAMIKTDFYIKWMNRGGTEKDGSPGRRSYWIWHKRFFEKLREARDKTRADDPPKVPLTEEETLQSRAKAKRQQLFEAMLKSAQKRLQPFGSNYQNIEPKEIQRIINRLPDDAVSIIVNKSNDSCTHAIDGGKCFDSVPYYQRLQHNKKRGHCVPIVGLLYTLLVKPLEAGTIVGHTSMTCGELSCVNPLHVQPIRKGFKRKRGVDNVGN
jgi:hypothetical protein